MDPFTIATGVAGLLSLTSEIVRIVSDYTGGVTSAAKDGRSMLTEITALNHVLEQLVKFLKAEDTNAKCRFRETSALCSVIAICKNHIETLYRKFRFQGKPEKDVLGRLKWPFEKGECQEIVEVLHRCSQMFMFSLQIANCELLSHTSEEVVQRLDEEKKKIDSIALMFSTIPAEMRQMGDTLADIQAFMSKQVELDKIAVSVESLRKGLQDGQRMKILNWLSPLQPQKRHQDVQSMRLDNTGGWLLNDHRFVAWLNGEKGGEPEGRLLCCYGMPGAGKTIICSTVIDYLYDNRRRLTSQGNVGIACFYCDYRDQRDQKGTPIIGSLVAQLLAGLSDIPEYIATAFTEAERYYKSLNCQQSLQMLQNLTQSYDRSFICIDAMDELDAETQETLLRNIKDLLSGGAKNTCILITGRPHIEPHVLQHFPKVPADRKIEIVASEDDIAHYLSHYIETKDPIPHASAMNNELKSKIITTIIKKSQGMFLLPALHIQAIMDEPTIGHREDALEMLPDKLHGAYEQTITRIRSQPPTRAMQGQMVLTWVFLAKRPLSLEELQHALAVRPDVATSRAFDLKRLCPIDVLLDSCLGLVIVDDETGTVRFVHFSLQEFLQKRVQDNPVGSEAGHASLARICLTYLQFYRQELLDHHKSKLCRGLGKCLSQRKYPLLRYAATEWSDHVRDSKDSSLRPLGVRWLRAAGDICASGKKRLPRRPIVRPRYARGLTRGQSRG